MANELPEVRSITSPQDIYFSPIDPPETQPLQVNIQVSDTLNTERSNSCNWNECRRYYIALYFLFFLPLYACFRIVFQLLYNN